MALRQGFKINRFLHLTRQKLHNVNHINRYSKNSKCTNPYIKSASTLTKNQTDSKVRKPNDERISATITTQNNFQGRNSAELPLLTSDLDNSQVTLRRKFAKSSTQNAITRPLKLPRLANPFPEPVKTLHSDTVSDDEKARLMHEQVKMETRFHLQMHQEMLLKQKMQKSNAEEEEQETSYPDQQEDPNYQVPQPQQNDESDQQPKYSFPQHQQQNHYEDSYQQLNYPSEQAQQSNYRKPKDYKDLLQDDQANKINQQQVQMQQKKQEQQPMEATKKGGVNPTENTSEDLDNRRPPSSQCRKRRNTRAARYLRNSWYPRHIRKQISRQYSTSSPTIDPEIITQSEKCDRVIKQLKSMFPEYRNLKKPLFIPGSTEENEFMKYVLKLIAIHKPNNGMNKIEAPFPSYSEVKTYRHVDNKTTDKFSPESHRFYSPKKQRMPKLKEPVNKVIPKFVCKVKSVTLPPKKKPGLTRQEAPYPSYTEVKASPYDVISAASRFGINNVLLRSKFDNKYYYSTSTKDSADVETLSKKKPPCKNPYPPIPECDYEETARKKTEKKRKKHCPKNDKKCCPENEGVDSSKIINKIKSWLSAYKPDADNIKISRALEDIDGRETYVIEVDELQEIKPGDPEMLLIGEQTNTPEIVEIMQPFDSKIVFPGRSDRKLPFKNVEYQSLNFFETHAPEMTDRIPVLTENIPEFISPVIGKIFCNPVMETSGKESNNKLVEKQLKHNKLEIGQAEQKSNKQNNNKIVEIQRKHNKLEIGTKDCKPKKKLNKTDFMVYPCDLISEDVKQKPKTPKVLQKKSEIEKIEDILHEDVKQKPKTPKVLQKKLEIEKVEDILHEDVKQKPKTPKVLQKKSEIEKIEDILHADEVKVETEYIYYVNKPTEEEIGAQVEEQIKKDRINKVKKFLAPEQEAEKVKKEAQVNKIKDYTIAKQRYEKAEIKTKEDRVKNLSALIIPKKKKKKINTFMANSNEKLTPLVAEAAMATKNKIKQNQSYFHSPQPTNIGKAFSDFKDLDGKGAMSYPQPCPVVTRKLGSPKSRKGTDCHNEPNDGCKVQQKEDECPPTKCRYKKKRKVPSCDDVKGNKNCQPIYNYIPGLEHNPEFALNPPKKTYFTDSNITQYINLKPEDIEMLANHNLPKDDEFVPFKLKSRFRK